MKKTKIKISLHSAQIPDRLFFRIRDVARLVGVKPHVLRYWEKEFPVISPQKSASGHRVYSRRDVQTVLLIKHLLHEERYSIEGARKRIKQVDVEIPEDVADPKHPFNRASQLQSSQDLAPGDWASCLKELQALVRVPVASFFQF
jgi:DNA-binding transcriptional MerR regulator